MLTSRPVRLCLLLAAFSGCLCCMACAPTREEALFERLLTMDYSNGIVLGRSPGQVTPTLGVPTTTASQQAGTLVQQNYLPEGEVTYASDRPQLQLTYVKDQLTRIMNFERPFEDEPQPPAPKRFTILAGLGLGSRKSEFTSKLGEPNYGLLKDQWRFTGKDGRSITIQAFFIENPDTKEPVCSQVILALSPKLAEQRGEQYEGAK